MGLFDGGKSSKGNGFDDLFMWPADIFWGGKKNDPILGGAYTGDQQQAVQDAMKNAEQQYAQYRPDMAQSRLNGLDQVLSLYQPAGNYLNGLYGQGSAADLSEVGKSPLFGTVGSGKIAGGGK